VPARYGADRFEEGPSQAVAVAYERLATDIRFGTRLSPTFGDAVDLHRLIDALERSEWKRFGRWQSVGHPPLPAIQVPQELPHRSRLDSYLCDPCMHPWMKCLGKMPPLF
jgi:hypothetical protein